MWIVRPRGVVDPPEPEGKQRAMRPSIVITLSLLLLVILAAGILQFFVQAR